MALRQTTITQLNKNQFTVNSIFKNIIQQKKSQHKVNPAMLEAMFVVCVLLRSHVILQTLKVFSSSLHRMLYCM